MTDIAIVCQSDDNCLKSHVQYLKLQSPRTVPRLKSKSYLVIVGGAPRMKTDPVCDAILKYDADAGSWDHVTTMPEPRHHHAGI